MKPTITWLLVANGTEAKVYENTGPNKGLTPMIVAALSPLLVRDAVRWNNKPILMMWSIKNSPAKSLSI